MRSPDSRLRWDVANAMMHDPHHMPDDKLQPEDLSFEEAMDSLESIVSSLETERLPLADMVSAYERGVKLLRTCRDRIDTARQRVELITADLEGKNAASLSEFQPMETPEGTASNAVPSKKTKRKPESAEPDEESPGDIRLF